MARSGKAHNTLRRCSPGRGGLRLGMRVALVSGPDYHPPGPRMLVSPDRTLAEFAEAVDVAVAGRTTLSAS